MNIFFRFILFIFILFSSSILLSASKFLDYSNLDHKISLLKLRAGNHTTEEEVNYIFKLNLNSQFQPEIETELLTDQKKKELTNKKISLEPKIIGELSLPSLTQWSNEKDEISLSISGEELRKLVAETMNKFEAKEHEVEISATIEVIKKGKKFYFWGEDTLITSLEYFPLKKDTIDNQDQPKNIKLDREDDKGMYIEFEITWQALQTKSATP